MGSSGREQVQQREVQLQSFPILALRARRVLDQCSSLLGSISVLFLQLSTTETVELMVETCKVM